jgi:hypothetical protein
LCSLCAVADEKFCSESFCVCFLLCGSDCGFAVLTELPEPERSRVKELNDWIKNLQRGQKVSATKVVELGGNDLVKAAFRVQCEALSLPMEEFRAFDSLLAELKVVILSSVLRSLSMSYVYAFRSGANFFARLLTRASLHV